MGRSSLSVSSILLDEPSSGTAARPNVQHRKTSSAMSDFALREAMDRSSACVAPLIIKKKASTTWSASALPASSTARSQSQLSPPLTPRAHFDVDMASAEPDSFPNYLRAFYHFHPSSTLSSVGEECSITVAINQGDVILVHSIHPNGWADGTLLGSGARGWLPTNYCEPYDHPAIANLLAALTRLWDLVRSGDGGNAMVFVKQDYVRSMIAGVRFLLERCDCLTRESPYVKAHVGVRRMRKGLLADLSNLVKTAKNLQQVVSQGRQAEEPIYDLLDQLVFSAFKVVTRAVRFLDTFTQEVEPRQQPHVVTTADGAAGRPPTPPRDVYNNTTELAENGDDDTVSPTDSASTDDNHVRRSQVESFTGPIPLQSPLQVSPAKSTLSKRTSISHRASYTSQVSSRRRRNLASEQLAAAHDSFLGSIGSLIGMHIQSRSSTELLTTTQQSVAACRQLLAVVEEVWQCDARRSEPLSEARDAMHQKLSELAQATKDVLCRPGSYSDDFVPAQGKEIVSAATNCVRAAGDCVAKAKTVIERIGDLEFERTAAAGPGPYTLLEKSDEARFSSSTDAHRVSQDSVTKPLPAPPTAVEKPLPEPPVACLAKSPSNDASEISSVTTCTAGIDIRLEEGNAGSDVLNASDSTSTYPNSLRGDAVSVVSHASTRATTPDDSPTSPKAGSSFLSSYASVPELRSAVGEDVYGIEARMLEKTYVHELVYKDGQIAGGSLPALVEQLTTHETTPDPTFVNTFYLTFRLFTTPVELARCLIDRFSYVEDSTGFAVPVRLRVHNVFKGWLESHWQADADADALGLILTFATGKLRAALPSAGKRLAELVAKVSQFRAGTPSPRLPSSHGKSSVSAIMHAIADMNSPSPIITKSQMSALRNARNGVSSCLSILDLDPLEIARQFTLIESQLFNAIQPEELLASEWTRKTGRAVNVRAMSKLSTDLANLVADTILQLEDPKKRAVIIKQWVKIAARCLELNNYDSLMAIICSLNSSMVMRLKRTWEAVSSKTKNRLEELRSIVNVGRNYAVLRKRIENATAPCIPFVGVYLTDLTFVDVGNQTTRQLPADGGAESGMSVINFDKHMRTAKIIGQLQRFQVPYALTPVPEMQEWMRSQIERVQDSDQSNVQSYYRRSLLLEPREPKPSSPTSADNESLRQVRDASGSSNGSTRDRFDFLNAFTTFKSSSDHASTQRSSS